MQYLHLLEFLAEDFWYKVLHTNTKIETNLDILQILPKCPKLNTTENYEI